MGFSDSGCGPGGVAQRQAWLEWDLLVGCSYPDSGGRICGGHQLGGLDFLFLYPDVYDTFAIPRKLIRARFCFIF